MTGAVPWKSGRQLRKHIEEAAAVTPLMLTRLLEHWDFEDVGAEPALGSGRIRIWRPKGADSDLILAEFTVRVYDDRDAVPKAQVTNVLRGLDLLARSHPGRQPLE